MFYSLRHSTLFRYSDAVRQSVMEFRMQPRSEGAQSVRQFDLTVTPRARAQAYRDFMGNLVHHFDVPGQHDNLAIIAESLVELIRQNRYEKHPKWHGTHWSEIIGSTTIGTFDALTLLPADGTFSEVSG